MIFWKFFIELPMKIKMIETNNKLKNQNLKNLKKTKIIIVIVNMRKILDIIIKEVTIMMIITVITMKKVIKIITIIITKREIIDTEKKMNKSKL